MKKNICSYCKQNGHYINDCNDSTINTLHNTLLDHAVIDLYCLHKFNFDFLLYKFNLLSTPELRVLGYKNNCTEKLSNNPNKQQRQSYINYLIDIYSYKNKNKIFIPYIDNLSLWNYARDIYRLVDKDSVLSIYCDIIKISPRPRCYNNININLDLSLTYENNKYLQDDHNCSICLNNIDTNSCLLNCNHEFCYTCVKKYLTSLYTKTNESIENEEFIEPICPLCRTYINNIILNDRDSFTYFLNTFYNEFTPHYFNTISTNNALYEHRYEEAHYYQYVLDSEYDSDTELSPYSFKMHINVPMFLINNDNLNNVIKYSFQIRILFRWLFFIGCIYSMTYIYNYNKKSYVYNDDDIFEYEIDDLL